MNANVYGKKQFYEMWYELFKDSLKGMNIGLGGSLETSGEENVLRMLNRGGDKEKYTVFDVGANVGNYTQLVINNVPNAQIHCFEPSASTYAKLCERIQYENVKINNFGLSDAITEATLYYDKENSGLASLYNRQLDYFGIDFGLREMVSLDTLDHYCEVNDINKIDFLKMDIEGHELKALNGAQNMLAEKRIDNIQIEFGGCNIDSRTYFRDFWNLLSADFFVYRILSDGLREIPKYGERLECFITTNYLFIKK